MSEKAMTATEVMEERRRMDLRRVRANVLLAAVMGELSNLVTDQREAYDRLYELFHREGVEILTDYTRSEIGLPPRSFDGWTDAEINALEMSRLETLLRPLRMVVPKEIIGER